MTGRGLLAQEAEALIHLLADGNPRRAVAAVIVTVDYADDGTPTIWTGYCSNTAELDEPDNASVNIAIGIADGMKGLLEEKEG